MPVSPASGSRDELETEGSGRKDGIMGLATSIVLFAIGAVLAFAITVTQSHGVNWNIVGDILMGVGAFGVLVSLMLWGAGPWGGYRRRTTMIDHANGRVSRREDVDSYL